MPENEKREKRGMNELDSELGNVSGGRVELLRRGESLLGRFAVVRPDGTRYGVYKTQAEAERENMRKNNDGWVEY